MSNATQVASARRPYTSPWVGICGWRRWLAALLTLLLTAVLQSARAQSGQPALVGEWLNGSASLADVSGYSPTGTHDGYAVGGGNYVFTNDVPPGKAGQSLFFYNGDTAIAVSNSSTLDANYTNTFDDQISTAFTVAFWAKGWPGGWSPFVSKDGLPTDAAGWALRAYGNRPCWTIQSAGVPCAVPVGTEVNGIPADLAGTNTFGNDGKWHVYVGTYSSLTGIRSLYVDGMLSGQENCNGLYRLAPLAHLCIGAKDSNPGNSFGNFFTGEIYDLRISNYDWNTNEVASYSALGSLAFSGPPVLHANQLVLTWSSGELLQATNLAGPWTPVDGATPPYTNLVNMAAPNMFFKLSNP